MSTAVCYLGAIGIPIVVGIIFAFAARYYNKNVASRTLSPEYFRAPSNYVVTVGGVAFPLIGAILALQQPERMGPLGRSLLVSGLLLFFLALLIGAWLTYAIISKAVNDKVVLTMPQDWLYSAALGLSYVFLIGGLFDCFGYFAFGLSEEHPSITTASTSAGNTLVVRPRARIGQSKDELSTALGSPEAKNGAGAWIYQTNNSTIRIRFGADGRIDAITEEREPNNAK